MGGYSRFLELPQKFGGYLQALLLAINQNRHGVQVVLKLALGAIFGMGNLVTDVGRNWRFE